MNIADEEMRRLAGERAKVMEAYANGEEIEYRANGCGWQQAGSPTWAWIDDVEYRIKPQPEYPRSGFITIEGITQTYEGCGTDMILNGVDVYPKGNHQKNGWRKPKEPYRIEFIELTAEVARAVGSAGIKLGEGDE